MYHIASVQRIIQAGELSLKFTLQRHIYRDSTHRFLMSQRLTGKIRPAAIEENIFSLIFGFGETI